MKLLRAIILATIFSNGGLESEATSCNSAREIGVLATLADPGGDFLYMQPRHSLRLLL